MPMNESKYLYGMLFVGDQRYLERCDNSVLHEHLGIER